MIAEIVVAVGWSLAVFAAVVAHLNPHFASLAVQQSPQAEPPRRRRRPPPDGCRQPLPRPAPTGPDPPGAEGGAPE